MVWFLNLQELKYVVFANHIKLKENVMDNMSMSTFSFILSIVMALMSLAFTLIGISMADNVALGIGELLILATVVFAFSGFVMLWRGE